MSNETSGYKAISNHALFNSIWGALFLASLMSVLVLSILPDSGVEQRFPGQDKVAHAIAFYWLLTAGWLGLQKSSSVMALAVLLAAFGVLIEALQYLGGYRSAELLDFVADLVGIGVGIALRPGRNATK